MNFIPIAVNLEGKRILIAGGGRVALHKLRTIIKFTKNITVAAPSVKAAIKRMGVKVIEKPYKKEFLRGAFLVYACTNDKKVNKQIKADANKKHLLVNTADDREMCDFISPAVSRVNKAVIAIYTDGKNPAMSADLKKYLKLRWNDFIAFHRLNKNRR